MLDRNQIKNAMRDRKLSVMMQETGLTRPTLMKFARGDGNVTPANLRIVSAYLTQEIKPATGEPITGLS